MLKEVNSAEFKELAGKGLVLADFFSPPPAGPCKMLSFAAERCGEGICEMILPS